MKKIKAIIFDIGGVFLDQKKGYRKKIIRDLYKKTGVKVRVTPSLKKLNDKLAIGKGSLLELIKKSVHEQNENKISKREAEKAYERSYENCSPINKEMIKLRKALKKVYRIYVLSDTNYLHASINKKRGVYDGFNKVFLSNEIGIKKPDPRIFKYMFKKINLKPEETIFIDDKEENIKTAKKLGMNAILFKKHKQLVRDLKKLGIKW